MKKQVAHAEISKSFLNWIYTVSGVAALMTGILLLIAMISLITTALQPQITNSWLSSLQNNWLIVILKLHSGFEGVHLDLLRVLNLLDIIILGLVGTMLLGLYIDLQRTARLWSIVALVQPFLGILIFLATKTAGRSTVMSAGLVASILMLRSNIFKEGTAYTGILASVLLLAGDISAGIPPNQIVALLFGISYVLLITWFFLIARRFLQLIQKGNIHGHDTLYFQKA